MYRSDGFSWFKYKRNNTCRPACGTTSSMCVLLLCASIVQLTGALKMMDLCARPDEYQQTQFKNAFLCNFGTNERASHRTDYRWPVVFMKQKRNSHIFSMVKQRSNHLSSLPCTLQQLCHGDGRRLNFSFLCRPLDQSFLSITLFKSNRWQFVRIVLSIRLENNKKKYANIISFKTYV